MPQCFNIVDEYNNPVQSAQVNIIVDNELYFTGNANPIGVINATISPYKDNLVYVRLQSYTPLQYVYNGAGSDPCITLVIHTCHPLQQEKLDEGRFLVWTPVAYCLRDQTKELSICDTIGDNPICDRFDSSEDVDIYPLPVKNSDVIKWIMDKSEVEYNNDLVENLQIGISKNGVLVQENIGTIEEFGSQLFCTATIPCLIDCEYEFVIYRKDIIDYIGVVITPPSTPDDCDGQIQAVVELGTPPYSYSIDNGETWQLSDTFTGLCAQSYTVLARDSDCSQGSKPAYLGVIDCGMFKGYTLQQVIDLGITLGQLITAGCTLCDFVPESDEEQEYGNLISNDWTVNSGSVTINDNELVMLDGDSETEQIIETLQDGTLSISFNYLGGSDEPSGDLGSIEIRNAITSDLLYSYTFTGSDDTRQFVTDSASFSAPPNTNFRVIITGSGIDEEYPLYLDDLTITAVVHC